MIASKQILSQVCLGDWLFSLNMKDTYFHIQIAPHHRRFLRFAFKGVAYQCTVVPFWAVPSSPHFYKVHGCGSFSAKTAGNTHLELLWRLAHPGPVGRWASISQIRAPQPIRVPRTQGQFCKKRAIHQPTNFIPGNSYRLSPNEGCGHARTCTGYSAARGIIQTRSPSPPQSIWEDAGPHGLSIFGTSVGPASNAAPSVLAENSSSSTRLASRTPPHQGKAPL